MTDLFSGVDTDIGGDIFPAATLEWEGMGTVLKKVGLISIGSVGGAVLRDRALVPVLRNHTTATLAQAGVGVIGAAIALSARSDLVFWPLVGVGVHGVTELLRQVFSAVGQAPAQQARQARR